MSEYQSVAVPFGRRGNRQVLTRKQLAEMPELVDFIARFPKCFECDPYLDLFIFYPDGDAPEPARISRITKQG